jgi:hypothetical protein
MHSPSSSISSIGEPRCIPSSDKLVKNIIITGTITTVDGETVQQVEGVTKAIEHVPHEILIPEDNTVQLKNVPPCICAKDTESNEADEEHISKGKADVCYGKKFRPDEGPAFSCKEFKKKELSEEVLEHKELSDKFVLNNDDSIHVSEFEKESEDGEIEYENSIKSEYENFHKHVQKQKVHNFFYKKN